MKVALCLIARLENKYLREYVEYYKNLGFDKIFIYDNNRPGEERIIDEVNDFVDGGFIEVIEWTDCSLKSQILSYQDCWDNHKDEYDWIAFFDADEYLVLNSASNIKDFLSNKIYDGYNVITVTNKDYDDNDIIINGSNTRLDKYTRENRKTHWVFVKSIVRCENNEVRFDDYGHSCHIPTIKDKKYICNVDGETNHLFGIASFKHEKNAFLKHFPTGCIDDFVKCKSVRKHINMIDSVGLEYFNNYNELTQEKIDYYNKYKKV